jgi:dimethylaniline monooxygenase (N-oxide forming)
MAAVKSLREEGFEVTAFERRSDVGGVWTFDESPNITSTTEGMYSYILSMFAVAED